MRIAVIVAALIGLLGLLCLPAGAATLLWSDDLESGSANWTTYPGCTAMPYATTATNPTCNHTPGGAAGFKFESTANRAYHNLDLGAYAGSTLILSAWIYDDGRDTDAVFDIRDADNNQVLGMGKDILNGDPSTYVSVYQCRALRNPDGQVGLNWVNTSIARSTGWHQFTVIQYRGSDAGKAEYYVDGALGYTATGILDYEVNQIVIGTGWNASPASGYIDDISVSALVPEPASWLTLGLGLIPLALRRRAR